MTDKKELLGVFDDVEEAIKAAEKHKKNLSLNIHWKTGTDLLKIFANLQWKKWNT